MNTQTSTRLYDFFKLIVAMVLIIILIILLLCAYLPTQVSPVPVASLTDAVTTQPGAKNPPISTAMQVPTPTVLLTATATPRKPLAPSPTTENTPIAQPQEDSCLRALPARLKVGDKVRVITNLNMRGTASIKGKWLLTNVTNTELEVIGGPVCEKIEGGAYRWWQVRRPDGKSGWSAEGMRNSKTYFLEPNIMR
jgi:hypothetical protein